MGLGFITSMAVASACLTQQAAMLAYLEILIKYQAARSSGTSSASGTSTSSQRSNSRQTPAATRYDPCAPLHGESMFYGREVHLPSRVFHFFGRRPVFHCSVVVDEHLMMLFQVFCMVSKHCGGCLNEWLFCRRKKPRLSAGTFRASVDAFM